MKYSNVLRRGVAFLVDSLLVYFIFVVVIQNLLFLPLRRMIFGSDDWFRVGWYTEAYTLLTISLPTWLYFVLSETAPWRATLGKRLLNLQTLDVENQDRITCQQAFTRTIIKLLPWEIAHLTNNIPTPMRYDPDAGFRFGFLVVPVLVVIYLVMVASNKNGRGIHDWVAKTVVVYSRT
jgi:uncharacterized RDD family membrane protein YckC